ncbi:MAG: glutamine--fructose-6-phosphate transaminase (isomerizing) [Nitrososphaerales archaeon]
MLLCGIVGYIGDQKAAPFLLEGLRRLEYRGYDSAGIATLDGKFIIKKGVGRISRLNESLKFSAMEGNIGIGHTRWATHGSVTEENSHPHWSCKAEVVIVHNGIIENYSDLKIFLHSRGHKFVSETDSEVIAHLIEEAITSQKDVKSAILSVVASLKGSYAFLAILKESPDMLIAVRKDAPLVLGIVSNSYFVSSDVLSFIDKTNQAIFMDNKEIALISKNKADIFDFSGKKVAKKTTTLAWEISDISKKEYLHFTLKEIHDQPVSLRQSLAQSEEEVREFAEVLKKAKNLFITGCGTSFHASLILKYVLAKNLRIRADVFLSSEIDQQKDLIDKDSVLLAISQSGETADVLNAVLEAKQRGAKILSIVNVTGSSLARESTKTLYTHCGPEVGVAATKSFTSQLSLMYLVAIAAAKASPKDLLGLQNKIRDALVVEEDVRAISEKFVEANDFYFIGRGDHFPIAMEGALKLKELSYVHAEGMAAGELKHGTLALIEQGTPVVLLNPPDETFAQTINSALELKARGAKIIGVSTKRHECYDEFIKIPELDSSYLYPIIEVVPLQMLAYFTAVARKLDPDYPRNLAKSVTVI